MSFLANWACVRSVCELVCSGLGLSVLGLSVLVLSVLGLSVSSLSFVFSGLGLS